jgi:hypothetical protein
MPTGTACAAANVTCKGPSLLPRSLEAPPWLHPALPNTSPRLDSDSFVHVGTRPPLSLSLHPEPSPPQKNKSSGDSRGTPPLAPASRSALPIAASAAAVTAKETHALQSPAGVGRGWAVARAAEEAGSEAAWRGAGKARSPYLLLDQVQSSLAAAAQAIGRLSTRKRSAAVHCVGAQPTARPCAVSFVYVCVCVCVCVHARARACAPVRVRGRGGGRVRTHPDRPAAR